MGLSYREQQTNLMGRRQHMTQITSPYFTDTFGLKTFCAPHRNSTPSLHDQACPSWLSSQLDSLSSISVWLQNKTKKPYALNGVHYMETLHMKYNSYNSVNYEIWITWTTCIHCTGTASLSLQNCITDILSRSKISEQGASCMTSNNIVVHFLVRVVKCISYTCM